MHDIFLTVRKGYTSATDSTDHLSQSVLSANSYRSTASRVSSGHEDRTYEDMKEFHQEIAEKVRYSVECSSQHDSYAGTVISTVSSAMSSSSE